MGIERREHEGFLELRLDRADKKNALTGAMYDTLTAALKEAGERPDIAAVMLAGNGGVFTAGNDIKDFLAPNGAVPAFHFIHAIAASAKPIVAAVQGMAVGIGTTMLFHCDLVYAAPGTRFLVPFTSLGIVPEAASSLLMPARMGYAKAAEMLLLGQPIDVEAAERGGIITAIVPADALEEHARAKARALAAMPPEALAATRKLMRGDRTAIDAQMAAEATAFAKAMKSAEAKEAFTAFLEKRPPNFKR